MRYLFFITVLSTLFILVGFTTWRTVQAFAPIGNSKYLFLVASVLLLFILVGAMVFETKLPLSLAKSLAFIGFSYLIFIVYLFLGFLLLDGLLLINKLIPFIHNIANYRLISFLTLSSIIIVLMAIGNYNFNHPQVVHLSLQSEKSQQHKTMKIVAVSDLHIGTSIGKKQLQKYVDLINVQNPDLVLFAGDLIDREMQAVEQQNLHEDLQKLQSKWGAIAILGNHEYFSGDLDRVTDFYKKSNIHLLKDQFLSLDNGVIIAGREDKIKPNRKELKEILSGADLTKPIILLDHQPFHLDDAEANQVDISFSGHTHNGQFFPGNLIVKKMYENGYGYLKKGATHTYVTSGLGIWGPQYRIGTQSELVVIEFSY